MFIDAHTRDEFLDLIDTYSAEWVIAAIKEAANHGARTIAYISRVLENWKMKGGISERPAQQEQKKYDFKPYGD